MDGIIQNVTIEVLGEKPILDGIAVVSAKPGDAFEVSMRNIDVTSKFYLGNILLDFLGLSNSGAYVRIPRNIEKGMYPFRVSSNGWDITFDEIIEIVESVVPHILSVSPDVAYTGQSIKITGKNFGTEVNDIVVKIGDAVAIVESLSDDEITIQIPTGVSGKGIAVKVIRKEVSAPETTTIDIKSLPFFMSFDDTNHPWTSAIATLSYDNYVKFGDEGYSLKVHGNGYMTIESPIFNTYELGAISNELLLDVWIPEDQANPFWYGEVQMSVNGEYYTPLPPGQKPLSAQRVKAELLYNSVPWDTVLFIACFAFVILSSIFSRLLTLDSRLSTLFFILCSLFSILSLSLRWYVSGHLPLSNTYETLQVIALTALILACFSARLRMPALIVAGATSLVAHIGALDPQITTLMPILQSPWLSSHVTTIMISYCLFALLIFRPSRTMLLWAEIMLGIGIILGSIWAKTAWGAYWQWDPKENWAAISFIIYLVPLLSRKIQTGRFSMFNVQCSMFNFYLRVAFLSILMTYFGCSYLLGGLHSYAN